MLIFIDESGDAGFKIQKGSSPYFVIVLVVFDDELDAEETALRIKQYRKSLGKTEKYEFKFNKSNLEYRKGFFKLVEYCNFSVRAIVFDKSKLYSTFLRGETDGFYGFGLRQVLEHNNQTIKNAKIRLDGSGERRFREQLTVYLRQSLNSQTNVIMKNLRFRDSKKDVLIQLADMVAGAIRRSFEKDKSDSSVYLGMLSRQLDDIWEFT